MQLIHRSKLFWFLVGLAVALVVIRMLLPFWVRDYVNKRLSELKDYRGHVEEVDLSLWRGAYKIRNVKVVKTSGDVPVPFFSAPLIDLSVEWEALFNRAFVGEICFQHPVINFVKAPSKAGSQAPLDEPWTLKIKQLFPLKINRAVVHDGEIHYRDFHASPKVDVVIDEVRMLATNLTNSKKLSKTLHASVTMEGRPLRAGDLRMKLDLNPYATKPTFNLETEIKELPLVKLNDFAKAYAAITFEKGTLRLATEFNARKGDFDGYVEPVFEHMSIFSPKHDSDNPISFVWQAIVGGLTQLIRNHPTDRFGTRVPVHGSFDNPEPAILTTVVNVFRNAIIKAFEGTLHEKDLPKVPQDQS
ncbi:MAG: DUF748 domain-containing protein [Chthoniobacterales bacterium]|nr:DUF748 domain-containing protein [Chthoniobacterales bacterium]